MKLAGAYINDDTYGRLVALAAANNRTLAGQCRHLFDRALKGTLQVPDCTTGPATAKVTAAAAMTTTAEPFPKPTLRAVAQALTALNAVPGAVAPPQDGPMACGPTHENAVPEAVGPAQPASGSVAATVQPETRPHSENLPVAGVGVAAVVPPVAGISATPGRTPATGIPRPARCAVPQCGGRLCGGQFSTRTPTMMKTPAQTTPPPGPLPHAGPATLSPHAERRTAP